MLSRRQHLVEAGALDVQDLAAQGQHRLVGAVAALLGAAAGAVALDDEDFAFGGIAFLAVGQLAGQGRAVQRALAAGQFARLAGGFAGGGGFHHLADDGLGFGRMLLEPGAQLVDDARLPRSGALPTETSLSLVWDENFGSGTLTDSTQVRPSRQSSPVSADLVLLGAAGMSSAYLVTTRVRPARKPARWVPPSRWGMLLVKASVLS